MAKKSSDLRKKMSPVACARVAKAVQTLRRAARKQGLQGILLKEINQEIRAAREARQRQWLTKNRAAVKAYNQRIKKRGTFAR